MNAWLERLQRQWQILPEAERRRVPLIVCLLLAGAYLAFYSLVTAPQISKLQGDINRLSGRLKKSATVSTPAPVVRGSGKLPAELQQELRLVEQHLQQQQRHLQQLQARLAPLDRLADHQALRLALTELANGADIEVLRLETKGLPKEEQRQAPSVERLRELAQKNPYGRPLLRLEARASYRGLMQFLDGLADLPFMASPVAIRIEVKTDGSDTTPATRQWLEMAVDLAL
ncbi:MAG: hypothetical protein RL210_331 [Pseudomonadota bacterium]|jgi:hypothetical protein|nr:hypothetical protein [Pseudomonadota bacterium]